MACKKRLLGLILVAALVPAGCKFVKIADEEARSSAGGTGAADDQAAFQKQAADMWAPKVLPYLEDKAIDLPTLRAALEKGIDAAGDRYGYREGAASAPWNFSVRFSGTVVEANTESRAATASVDSDGDGKTDAVLQLGPVILGTSLRDTLPFVAFGDYTNQIAFAGIATALNAQAYETVLKPFPRDSIVGTAVKGLGTVSLGSAGGEIRIVPVELEAGS